MIDKIFNKDSKQKCYFRTSVEYPYSKTLIQITNRCNMKCKHCFVEANSDGRDISLNEFKNEVMTHLEKWKTTRVTLTGGEPLLNENILDFVELLETKKITVGICTNGMLITEEFIKKISKYKNLHLNISLDGFSEESYSKFRGVENKFNLIKKNIELAGFYNILQGILVTPNNYASIDEYVHLCKFAMKNNAKYVLFNPIAALGRGTESILSCGVSLEFLNTLYLKTKEFQNETFSVSYMRFPNNNTLIGECILNRLYYIYSDGNVTKCPYVSFANAKAPIYKFNSNIDFELGNIFKEEVEAKEFDIASYTNVDCIAHL